MIKHVFLDLDDTVFDFGKAERRALTLALTDMGIPVTDELLARYSVINIGQWQLLEKGVITRDEVVVNRFAELAAEYGFEYCAAEVNRCYEGHLAVGHFFMPGAEELLDTLYGKYHLYIASNGLAATQAGRIKSAGIAGYFDGIFVSETMGTNKPKREYFQMCFDTIKDFVPDEAVIIGDSLTSDILGGINAGIHTVWYDTKGRTASDIVPEYTVHSLSEIPELLKTI